MHHSQRKDQRLHCIDAEGIEHTLPIRPCDLIVAAKICVTSHRKAKPNYDLGCFPKFKPALDQGIVHRQAF